jgi:hypothetical protein
MNTEKNLGMGMILIIVNILYSQFALPLLVPQQSLEVQFLSGTDTVLQQNP